MAERPVNLNKARKARQRAERRVQADRNAVLHGLPKAEKLRARAEAQREKRVHESGRRDGSDTPGRPED